MIDSYHGRYTNAMCVVPIHADVGDFIFSRLDESVETSLITRPDINQITVTITDEHGNVIKTDSEVNMVLLFQYYKIPVLHKPIQDVRDRLRYLRELMGNKKRLATIKNGQKKRKTKKERGKAKTKSGPEDSNKRPEP
jgi:hypothetical protein